MVDRSPSFFDLDDRLAELSLKGDGLERVRALIPPGLPVTVLPTQAIGQSDEHVGYPGTLTLSATTVIRAWIDRDALFKAMALAADQQVLDRKSVV